MHPCAMIVRDMPCYLWRENVSGFAVVLANDGAISSNDAFRWLWKIVLPNCYWKAENPQSTACVFAVWVTVVPLFRRGHESGVLTQELWFGMDGHKTIKDIELSYQNVPFFVACIYSEIYCCLGTQSDRKSWSTGTELSTRCGSSHPWWWTLTKRHLLSTGSQIYSEITYSTYLRKVHMGVVDTNTLGMVVLLTLRTCGKVVNTATRMSSWNPESQKK